MLPERPASSDLVLPHPRLRLVNAQRACRANRRAELLRIETLLVNSMSGFMQNAEQSFIEVVGVVARGDADVAWPHAAAEGVRRHIEPAGVEVEADGGCRFLTEDLLAIDRILAFQDFPGRFLLR